MKRAVSVAPLFILLFFFISCNREPGSFSSFNKEFEENRGSAVANGSTYSNYGSTVFTSFASDDADWTEDDNDVDESIRDVAIYLLSKEKVSVMDARMININTYTNISAVNNKKTEPKKANSKTKPAKRVKEESMTIPE